MGKATLPWPMKHSVCCSADECLFSGMWMSSILRQTAEQHQQSDPTAPWRLAISTKIDRHEGHFVCVCVCVFERVWWRGSV